MQGEQPALMRKDRQHHADQECLNFRRRSAALRCDQNLPALLNEKIGDLRNTEPTKAVPANLQKRRFNNQVIGQQWNVA